MPVQVITLTPSDYVTFSGKVSSGNVLTSVDLENPINQSVFFKIKTTKPERYYVSPAYGIIHPKETLALAVKLKEADLTSDEIIRDKFLIQTILSENVARGVSPEEAFRRVKIADLMETKLKVKVNDEIREHSPLDDERSSKSYKSAKFSEPVHLTISNGSQDDPYKYLQLLYALIAVLLTIIALLLIFILHHLKSTINVEFC